MEHKNSQPLANNSLAQKDYEVKDETDDYRHGNINIPIFV